MHEGTFWDNVNALYLVSCGGDTGYTMGRTHCEEQLKCVHFTECKLYLIIKKRVRQEGERRK